MLSIAAARSMDARPAVIVPGRDTEMASLDVKSSVSLQPAWVTGYKTGYQADRGQQNGETELEPRTNLPGLPDSAYLSKLVKGKMVDKSSFMDNIGSAGSSHNRLAEDERPGPLRTQTRTPSLIPPLPSKGQRSALPKDRVLISTKRRPVDSWSREELVGAPALGGLSLIL